MDDKCKVFPCDFSLKGHLHELSLMGRFYFFEKGECIIVLKNWYNGVIYIFNQGGTHMRQEAAVEIVLESLKKTQASGAYFSRDPWGGKNRMNTPISTCTV